MSGTVEPTVDVELKNVTPAELVEIGQVMAGGTIANTDTTSTGGGTTPAPIVMTLIGGNGLTQADADRYWPANPLNAPPSPDGAVMKMAINNGVASVGGAPYLVDGNGALVEWVKDASGNYVIVSGTGLEISINGILSGTGNTFQEVAILQGQIWVAMDGNIQGQFEIVENPTAGFVKKPWPAPWTTTGGTTGTTPLPAMPASPVAMTPAPGSSGNVLMVGPDQTYKTWASAIAAAKAGDTIKAAPSAAGVVFPEAFAITVPLLIDGGGKVTGGGSLATTFSGGAIIDGSSLADPSAYPYQQGGIVITADCIFQGLEVRGFGLQESSAQATAGIRVSAACTVTFNDFYIHDNQDGVFCGFGADITANNGILANNGLGDGYTHNWYGSGGVHMVWNNVTSIVPPVAASTTRKTGSAYGGHALKCYTPAVSLTTCYLAAADASVIAFEEGTTQIFSISGTTLVKNANDANHTLLTYGNASGANNGYAGGTITGSTLIANCASPFILTYGGTITVSSSTRQGSVIDVQGGGAVNGLP
jgi:hypothetical protein